MATVSKGRTFVSGETVTPAKLNELVDNATVTSIVDADVSASAAIALSKLATGALPTAITVASANLVDGTIVNADISASAAIAGSKLADASVAPAKLSQPYTLDIAKASTSGPSVDFTGIPSWAKRITVMFDGVSTNGTSAKLIQLGDAGGFETTGYLGGSQTVVGAQGFSGVYSTAGIPINSTAAADAMTGSVVFSLLSASTNTWVAQGVVRPSGANTAFSAGSKSLSDTLTQVRITTVNGADTFDAGTINIAYEG